LARQRARQFQGLQQPFVERAVYLELQAAEAVGDALHVVTEAVSEVVHGVDAPVVAGLMM
jgi:hypothetical protein